MEMESSSRKFGISSRKEGRTMICSARNATLGAAMRFVAISTCLMLAGLVVADCALAKEEPTLKEIIKGPSKEEQVKEQPAQKPAQKPKKKAPPVGPADDFDRGIPRTSVAGFIAAAEERDYKRAAEYLDLRRLPRGVRKRTDRGWRVNSTSSSIEPSGSTSTTSVLTPRATPTMVFPPTAIW
jgi:hypothetical protein